MALSQQQQKKITSQRLSRFRWWPGAGWSSFTNTHQKLTKKTTKFYNGNDRYCMREKKKFGAFFFFFQMINKGFKKKGRRRKKKTFIGRCSDGSNKTSIAAVR
jgi:hypothetical protein